MTAAAILAVWIVWYLAHQAWETFLTLLNLRHSARHPQPPPELNDVLDQATVTRSRAYLAARSGLNLLSRGLRAAVAVVVVASGALGALDQWLLHWLQARGIASPLLAGTLYVVLLVWASSLLTLGLRLYGQFVIEARFGFNNMTWRTFLLDQVKGALLSLVLGVPLLLGLKRGRRA